MLVKICLPLLVLLLLDAYPNNRAVEESLRQARIAQRSVNPQFIALQLRRAVDHEPWRTELLEEIGWQEHQAGRLAEAVQALERAQASQALSLEGAFLLGELYQQMGSRPQALTQWQSILTDSRSDLALRSRVYERLVQDARDQGELPAAAELLRAWRSGEPENASVAFLLGLHLAVLDPTQALPLLQEAARLDPAYTATVQAVRRGLNQAAASEDDAYGWLMIGRALGSAGYWQLAAAAFEQAVEAAPEYAEAWAFLGEARAHTGGSARPAIDRAIALDPQSITVRALRALSLRRQGDADQALELLLSVAQAEPLEPVWQVEIANVYLDLGDLISAQQHFEQAIAIAPEVSVYWQHLARFSIQYQYHAATLGLPAARQAVLLSPDDPAALDALGWALLTLEDYTTAERFLQRAVEIRPTYSPALLHLAQLYIYRQEYQQAYGYLKRAQQSASDDQTRLITDRLLRRYYNEDG